MELKEFSQSKSVKIACSFCGNEIECPEDILKKSKKHMCYECFITRTPSNDDIRDVHVDIPLEKMPETVASRIADEMVENLFSHLWTNRKTELKEYSKKELATEMFGAGAYLGVKAFMENMKKIAEDDEFITEDEPNA